MLNIFLQKCAHSIINGRGGKSVIYVVSNCTSYLPVLSGSRQHSHPVFNFCL